MEQITMVRVEDLHPHEQNPRIDAASVTDLVESVREHGIEVPLVAAPSAGAETAYVVLAGHRRLTAAHALGLDEVPVQVRPDLTDARAQLAFMATENILRDQLTAVEESRLVQDMLDLGMTQAEVAKQTALGKQRVRDRVKLSKLAEQTGEKVHRGQITVDDALVIAEYSDDPEAAKELEGAAGTYNFDYYASRAKARREARKLVDAARKQAKKDGLRIVDEGADFVPLPDLIGHGWHPAGLEAEYASDADMVDALAAAHADCPGHSMRVIDAGYNAGEAQLGCDAVAEQHTGPDVAETEPEPADPWDEITPEDFAAARIHREAHLARALPQLDVTAEAAEIVAGQLTGQCWREWGEDKDGVQLLHALTGAEGKTATRKKLQAWPLPLLVWVSANWWDLASHHRYQAEGRQGSSYWGEKGKLRQLLDRTDYAYSEPEQRAILLATGKAHDATDTEALDAAEELLAEAGAALAEGGEAA